MAQQRRGPARFGLPQSDPYSGLPEADLSMSPEDEGDELPRPVDPTSPAQMQGRPPRPRREQIGTLGEDSRDRHLLGLPVQAWILGTIVMLVVVAVLLFILSFVGDLSLSSAASTTEPAAPVDNGPTVVATRYLTALSDADAEAALAVMVAPPSKEFLTDPVLRAQQQQARISTIVVSRLDSAGSSASVHATFSFGGRPVDGKIFLVKRGGAWLVDPGTVRYDIPELKRIPRPTLFGRPAEGRTFYLFPGPVQFGSAAGGVQVDQRDPDGWPTLPTTTTQDVRLASHLSEAGRTQVLQAVSRRLGACLGSRQLEPAGCPQAEFDAEGIAGSACWYLRSRPSDLKVVLDPSDNATAHVSGNTKWEIEYSIRDYTGKVRAKSHTITVPVDGTVDLAGDRTFQLH